VKGGAGFIAKTGRGSFLEDLLIAALDRAIAFAEGQHRPFPSPKICTSTWRPRSMKRSMNTPPEPKLRSLSRTTVSNSRRSSASSRQTFMPIPPPPAVLLSMTG
jgi:hypothetical protein